jgi:hypothetical protein
MMNVEENSKDLKEWRWQIYAVGYMDLPNHVSREIEKYYLKYLCDPVKYQHKITVQDESHFVNFREMTIHRNTPPVMISYELRRYQR